MPFGNSLSFLSKSEPVARALKAASGYSRGHTGLGGVNDIRDPGFDGCFAEFSCIQLSLSGMDLWALPVAEPGRLDRRPFGAWRGRRPVGTGDGSHDRHSRGRR